MVKYATEQHGASILPGDKKSTEALISFQKYFSGNPGLFSRIAGRENPDFGHVITFIQPSALITDKGFFWSGVGSLDERKKYYLLWPEIAALVDLGRFKRGGWPDKMAWEFRRVCLALAYLIAGCLWLFSVGQGALRGWLALGSVIVIHLSWRWWKWHSTITIGSSNIVCYAGAKGKAETIYDILERGAALYKKAKG